MLQDIKSPQLFNPYSDVCEYNDIGPISPMMRTNNLRKYLTILKNSPNILIGEAPGYLGCRRTGLAFTDELTYPLLAQIYGLVMSIATKSGKNKEQSATFVWGVLSRLKNPPFLWNIVPLHPFDKTGLSNRTPRVADIAATKTVTTYFLDNVHFENIYAVGHVSERMLNTLGFDCTYIRHPARGGSKKFTAGILEHFETKDEVSNSTLNTFF